MSLIREGVGGAAGCERSVVPVTEKVCIRLSGLEMIGRFIVPDLRVSTVFPQVVPPHSSWPLVFAHDEECLEVGWVCRKDLGPRQML